MMTQPSCVKLASVLGGVMIIAGITALSLYNYRVLASIQAEDTTPVLRPPVPTETELSTGIATRPVTIDPGNDPLAPVNVRNPAPPRADRGAQRNPALPSKTYETPMKSPVLVQ